MQGIYQNMYYSILIIIPPMIVRHIPGDIIIMINIRRPGEIVVPVRHIIHPVILSRPAPQLNFHTVTQLIIRKLIIIGHDNQILHPL